ncbi:S46 family peptidase [Parabacteroides sp. OttesenSCG-928-N08]|nr:S46 family peptidase [Parabacteroides sp. OttesenSCG-928-N08]
MRKLILCVCLAAMLLPGRADEGMWILPLLNQQKEIDMKALGLKLDAADIYNPDGSSLKDAVVIFGGGCTGEVVSPDGLILTNHHCGYGQIQQHSSLEHDYLTDGFWASSRDKELPNPGLSVTFIEAIEDVTEYVNGELAKEEDTNILNFLSTRYLDNLAKQRVGERFLTENPGTVVEIRSFYGGNVFYMFTMKRYSDVRLVGAPPSSIGKFGGDTDNWIWPRHTGDFSIFRVYADKEGNPAPYSPDNVPLRPKRWLKISLKGYQENDFAMMVGFPGRTYKYYTSWEVVERRDIDNTVRITMREKRQEAMLAEMTKDPLVNIQYASKYTGSTNSYKSAIGMNWAIDKRHFEEVKRKEQEKLLQWAKENNKPEYEEALELMEQIIHERKDLRFRSWMLDEALLRSVEFAKVPIEVDSLITTLKGKDKQLQQEQLTLLDAAYRRFANKDYSRLVDRKVSKVMIKEYLEKVPYRSRPAYFQVITKKFDDDVDRFVDYLFDRSIYGSDANFAAFMKKPTAKALQNDPMIRFAKSLREEQKALTLALADFDADHALAHRSYVKGLLEMYKENANFPDANFTLRVTYGSIKGYSPRDCEYFGHQTTLDGVMEKENPNDREFEVAPRLKELFISKDFGKYANVDGNMPVAFCATTHSTGGNSGSPVLNGNGELIGINFDRNWEGVGGDIQYLPDFQRSIIVDIRYVLFVIDKYAGASYLLDEMEIID